MHWKPPKNTGIYYWTEHVQGKMRYYGLSAQKILGVIRRPKRIETGIAPDTVAVMQPGGSIKYDGKKETWNQEIWTLYQTKNQKSKIKITMQNEKLKELQKRISISAKITIISAWRYPGVSREKDQIPDHVWREIEEMGIQ